MRVWLHLPLRLRLTAAFALVMAVVLTATGGFLYVRLAGDLDATITQGLQSRTGDVSALVQQTGRGLNASDASALAEQGDSFAQLLTLNGAIADATPTVEDRPLLSAAEIAQTASQPLTLDRPPGVAGEDPVRLLGSRVTADGRDLVVVVGASTDTRSEALRNLAGLMLIGGPIALLLACLAGYGLAAAALGPVERMRRQADEIGAATPAGRLDVPVANDEISRLGHTLNSMLARLDVAFSREQSFVADASHELRTPLAILKAELEFALRPARSASEREDALRSAAEETDRLVQLAEDLLVLARNSNGQLPVRFQSEELKGLLQTVADRFAQPATDAAAAITVACPPRLHADVDSARIEQALGNLLSNALQHGATNVTLKADTAGRDIVLSVSDNGNGFPPAFLDSAFERFTRADHARSRGGTGLGLAIVRLIATAHGGTADAANQPSGGATVWLTIPQTPAGPKR